MSTAPMPITTDLPGRISALQTKIKELKMSKQDASAEVDEMKQLKALLGDQKKDTTTGGGFQLKTPKGTTDHKPEAALLRRKIFSTLEGIFVKYGGSTIDTPVFELREILAGKYGEDSKLIYDLQDQGGELCSLRYDLTVGYCKSTWLTTGPLCTIPCHERYHLDEAIPHWQSVPTRSASHVQGADEGILPMRMSSN
jgi:histidyl-tRNA synthetase